MSINISVEQYSAELAHPENVLARFVFKQDGALGELDLDTGMPLLSSDGKCEVWRVSEPVVHEQSGFVKLAVSENYCLVAVEFPVEMSRLAETSKMAYNEIFEAMRVRNFSQIVKAWNYVPDINGGGDGDREFYKQFCIGRAESFIESGVTETSMPAGTAVGTAPGEPLRVFVLSSRDKILPIENPRQIAAYNYPRQYGPKSPSFSRAMRAESGDIQQFFLSGTASITGHSSLHVGLLEEQVLETVENISVLVGSANSIGGENGFSITSGAYRAHIKKGTDVEPVLRVLAGQGFDVERVIPVEADICRRELLVEIDGFILSRVV